MSPHIMPQPGMTQRNQGCGGLFYNWPLRKNPEQIPSAVLTSRVPHILRPFITLHQGLLPKPQAEVLRDCPNPSSPPTMTQGLEYKYPNSLIPHRPIPMWFYHLPGLPGGLSSRHPLWKLV